MNKKKKLTLVLIIIMLFGTIFSSKTYAALSCNVNLNAPKKEVTYKEQFYVYVAISNLQTTKGIIAIGAELSYDTKSLTLVDIEGENKWSAPFYSSSTGKLTSVKNKLSTSNENVFKIIFEVNEKGKTGNSAWIKINNFEISDGDEEKNCGGKTINIAIGEKNTGDNSEDNNQGGNNQGSDSENNNQGGNNQGGNSGNNNQGGSNQGSNSGNNNQNSGKPTQKPVSGNTNKPNNTTKNENTSNGENENTVTNTVENIIDENTVDNENVVEDNNIQNVLEEDNNKEETKEIEKPNKGLFYMVSIITIIAIIGILYLIRRYWKTNS